MFTIPRLVLMSNPPYSCNYWSFFFGIQFRWLTWSISQAKYLILLVLTWHWGPPYMTLKNDQELQKALFSSYFCFFISVFSIYVKQIAYRIYSFKVIGYKLGLSIWTPNHIFFYSGLIYQVQYWFKKHLLNNSHCISCRLIYLIYLI
jgi:hypothetical protein